VGEEQLAEKISTETPWWAKAPVWLAAGIVGVPSLIAISAGWFIAQGVNAKLNTITQYDLSTLTLINEQNNTMTARWENMRRLIVINTELLVKNCVRASHTDKERDDCIESITPSERKPKPP